MKSCFEFNDILVVCDYVTQYEVFEYFEKEINERKEALRIGVWAGIQLDEAKRNNIKDELEKIEKEAENQLDKERLQLYDVTLFLNKKQRIIILPNYFVNILSSHVTQIQQEYIGAKISSKIISYQDYLINKYC